MPIKPTTRKPHRLPYELGKQNSFHRAHRAVVLGQIWIGTRSGLKHWQLIRPLHLKRNLPLAKNRRQRIQPIRQR
jgi:hypothetical protein